VSVYSTKTYLGGKLGLNIDNLNNDLLPTRGVLWNTEFSTQFGMNEQSNNLTRLITDLTLYSSLSYPAKVVSVLRLGGGRIYSKEYEYFQALSIGANNYLRGFRKNRFSGSGLAYGSLELRIKLLGSKSYIFPGDIGLIGFNDVGRVWVKNDQSKKWHYSYGGGLYYAAYNLALISATIGFSEEEKLFNFTIGTKFNITF
jgi:outer membrane protein assembly factor BamA